MSLIENLCLQNLSYDDCDTLIEELKEQKRILKSEKSIKRLELRKERKEKTKQRSLEIIQNLELKLMKEKSKSIYKNSEVTLIDVNEYNKETV